MELTTGCTVTYQQGVMAVTTGCDGTRNGVYWNSRQGLLKLNRVYWNSQQGIMVLTKGFDGTHKGLMELTTGCIGTHKGCNGTHNRI